VSVKLRKSEESRQIGSRNRSSSSGLGSPTAAGPIPASPTAASARSRLSAPQARDARVPRESVADLAEFIRSTGPTRDLESPSPLRGAAVRSSGLNSGRVYSTGGRPKPQPREATVNPQDDNSDLIDFIRRGPAGPGLRMPRTAAASRGPADADQMSGAVGGRAGMPARCEQDIQTWPCRRRRSPSPALAGQCP